METGGETEIKPVQGKISLMFIRRDVNDYKCVNY